MISSIDSCAAASPTSGTEPAAYQVTASDPDLTAPDDLGIRTLTDAGLTNVPPMVFAFDNLAVSP